VQFRLAHRPFQPQKQPVVKVARIVEANPITVNQDEFYREVDCARPAHTRPVYQIDLPLETFDAWDFSLEAGLTFPERIQTIRATGEHLFDCAGQFDSWSMS